MAPPNTMNMDKFRQQVQKQRLEAEQRSKGFSREWQIGGATYVEWRPKETLPGKPANEVRIGPPNGEGNEICYESVDIHRFKVGDEWLDFICPRTLSRDAACPACEAQRKLYQEWKARSGGPSDPDKQRSDDIRSRTVAVFAILDRHDLARQDGRGGKAPNWQVMVIGHGQAGAGRQTTFDKLSGKFERYGDLTHPTEGRWIRIPYTMGTAPGTNVKSARYGDWDFEPLEPPGPIGRGGWDVGLPDLRQLRDADSIPTAEEIAEWMGLTEPGTDEGPAARDFVGGTAEEEAMFGEDDNLASFGAAADAVNAGAEEAGEWDTVPPPTPPKAVAKTAPTKPPVGKPTTRRTGRR